MRLPWMTIAAVFGGAAVIIGAMTAHFVDAEHADVRFQVIGLAFHMFHVAPLLAIAFMNSDHALSGTLAQIAGVFFVAGILLFSGSLYYMPFGDELVGASLTPVGGISFILGWVCLAVSGFLIWRRGE
ncbi:MAG: DUF423 domain-containing protein [Sneathiella sp.]